MTAVEKALRETIRTQKAALAAKDETIAALKAVVDLYRSGHVGVSGNVGISPQPEIDLSSESSPYLDQKFEAAMTRMWLDEDEEDLQALIESGQLPEDKAIEAMSAMQSRRAPIHLAT